MLPLSRFCSRYFPYFLRFFVPLFVVVEKTGIFQSKNIGIFGLKNPPQNPYVFVSSENRDLFGKSYRDFQKKKYLHGLEVAYTLLVAGYYGVESIVIGAKDALLPVIITAGGTKHRAIKKRTESKIKTLR